MPNVLQTQDYKFKDELILRIIQTGGRFLLNYIKYCFLTGSVFFTLTALLFIVINLKPDFSFGFLSIFSFIDPVYQTGTFDLDLKSIIQIFAAGSLVLLVIADLTKIILGKLFNVNLEIKPKSKRLALLGTTTLTYFFAALLVFFDNTLDTSLSFVLAIFYLGSIITLTGYIALMVK